MIFLWKSCTKRDSKLHGRQQYIDKGDCSITNNVLDKSNISKKALNKMFTHLLVEAKIIEERL